MGLNDTFKSNLELPLFWFNSMSYNDRLMQAADTRSLDRRCSASDFKRKFILRVSGSQNECINCILEPFDVKTSWWPCRKYLESPFNRTYTSSWYDSSNIE